MNNTLIIPLLLAIMLSSCAVEPKIVYKDRIVEVPKIVLEECPPVPVVNPLTSTPLDELHLESKDAEIARAYVKTVEIQDNKLDQYKEALDALEDESE